MGYIPHNVVIDDTMICRFTNYGWNENQMRNLLTQWSEPVVKINHEAHPNTEDTVNPYQIDATIRSGGNLLPDTIRVYWNTDGSTNFNQLNMSSMGNDNYQTFIPPQPVDTTVYYYIHAEADNGKSSTWPLRAPDNLLYFHVIIDTEPPEIDHTPIEVWLSDYWPATVEATITDMIGVQSATVEFSINDGPAQEVPMTNVSGDQWEGVFTGDVFQDDIVRYRLHAVDSSNAQNAAVLPETGWFVMSISEMVTALVLDLDGNQESGPILYDTLVNLGYHTHYMNELPPLLELYESIWVCLGIHPNNHTLEAAVDTALRDYLVAGHNIYLESGNFWGEDPRVALWFEFGIGAQADNAGDAGDMIGLPGSVADGMSFAYTGNNARIDRLRTRPGSVGVLENISPEYLTMVSRDSGDFKTVGASVEFGGLTGPDKNQLLINIANFFGLEPGPPPGPGCDILGADVSMPSHHFVGGDICNTIVTLCNPTDTSYMDVPLFVILDVYGMLFFWPGFTEDADFQIIDLPPDETIIEILPDFIWPSDVGAADGIHWYAGMTTPDMTQLFGEFGMWTFGWN